jgi:hypothetical protein
VKRGWDRVAESGNARRRTAEIVHLQPEDPSCVLGAATARAGPGPLAGARRRDRSRVDADAPGTPGFLINGHVEVGWASLPWLEQVIRAHSRCAGNSAPEERRRPVRALRGAIVQTFRSFLTFTFTSLFASSLAFFA